MAFRGPAEGGNLSSLDVRMVAEPSSHADAIAHWGHTVEQWAAVAGFGGRVWDDHVRDAITEDDGRSLFATLEGLRMIAEVADELAIWYAAFPDEIDVVGTPDAFCRTVELQREASMTP